MKIVFNVLSVIFLFFTGIFISTLDPKYSLWADVCWNQMIYLVLAIFFLWVAFTLNSFSRLKNIKNHDYRAAKLLTLIFIIMSGYLIAGMNYITASFKLSGLPDWQAYGIFIGTPIFSWLFYVAAKGYSPKE